MKGEPLTPRAEFDEVIAEQREIIAEQAETITEQEETIGSQGERITELSGEVTELSTENTRLETQHDADQNTIQYLINNPPEVRLQSKSVQPTPQMQVVEPDEGYQGLSVVTVGAATPARLQSKEVLPSQITKFIIADEGYDGLSSVTVDSINAEQLGFESEYYAEGHTFMGIEGTYNPLPEGSDGGIYLKKFNEYDIPKEIIVYNIDGKNKNFEYPIQNSALKTNIKKIIFRNVKNYYSFSTASTLNESPYLEELQLTGFDNIGYGVFSGCPMLKKVVIQNIKNIGVTFFQCHALTDVFLSSQIQTMQYQTFENCPALTNVVLEQGFNSNNLNVSASTRFTAETIVACLEALADRTGETAYTITFGTTNLNKLTAEQKAIATNKNWNLA